MTELHRGRAGRLAPSARHAFFHRGAERVVDGCIAGLDGPHRGDAPARRCDLTAGDPVGRAVRKAQTARHARVQRVGIEAEQSGHDVNRLSGADDGDSVSTPDRRLPSHAASRVRSAAGSRSRRRRPVHRPPGASSHRARARPTARAPVRPLRRPPRAPCRRRAPRTIGRGAPSAPLHARTRPGATEIRPRCAPSGSGGGAVDLAQPVALRVHVGVDAFEQHYLALAVPQARRRRDTGSSASVLTNQRAGPGPRPATQSRLLQNADRAQRTDEQAREVVAGDVLDRRAAAFHQPAVAGLEAHLEHVIAQRSVPQPAHARQAARQDAADGRRARAGIERGTPDRARRARRRASSKLVPAPTVTVMSAGSYAMTPAGARTSTAPVGGGPPTSQWVRAPTGVTTAVTAGPTVALISTCPRGRAGARRSGSRAAAPSAGWRSRRDRTRRADGPARRGRRERTCAP